MINVASATMRKYFRRLQDGFTKRLSGYCVQCIGCELRRVSGGRK